MARLRIDTYGSQQALELSFDELKAMMLRKGVKKLYVKKLAANDNSKNQIYLGGDLSSVNKIPIESLEFYDSSSKRDEGKKASLIQGSVRFAWIDQSERVYPAPNAKLIVYPQYPEVRFSGFLRGSEVNLSEWMDVRRQGRSLGRYLFFGVDNEGSCIGYLSTPNSRISKEFRELHSSENQLLEEVSLYSGFASTSKSKLLSELLRIHNASPIDGKKLDGKTNLVKPYRASNGGGYTLEAELGIVPNGHAAPDFEGWEVKAHAGHVVTLMTPEPNGGLYKQKGVDYFVRTYGYPDRSGIQDRLNFGGVHVMGVKHHLTGLILTLRGYTPKTGTIDPGGGLCLIDDSERIAAEWSFAKLLEHWKKKHAKAVYVPYQRDSVDGLFRYSYSHVIGLGEGTDFLKFIDALYTKSIVFDPGIKLEGASRTTPDIKRRSQFRVKEKSLASLYNIWEKIDLLGR